MSKEKRNLDNSLRGLLQDLNLEDKRSDGSRDNELPMSATTNKWQTDSLILAEEKALQPSQMLRHYYIQNKLGSGGMGEVFAALDTKTQQVVAIKSMKFSSNETARSRFVREYKFLRAVTHESLINAYDFFKEGTNMYMVLEFVEGESLKEILEQHIPLSLADRIAIASKIARGVEVLNTAGIIHRDIKPANIMVNRSNGMVKVLDLGLSKQVKQDNQLTVHNQVIGTAMYLSPEQTEEKVTMTSDVFSLGIVLYQLFTATAQSPFHADNVYGCYFKVCNHDPPRISKVVEVGDYGEIYEHLSQIVAKAMAKKSSERWSDMKYLGDELQTVYRKLQQPTTQTFFSLAIANAKLLDDLYKSREVLQDEDVQQNVRRKAKINVKPRKNHLQRAKKVSRAKKSYVASPSTRSVLRWRNMIFIAVLLTLFFAFLGGSKTPKEQSHTSQKINTQKTKPKELSLIPADFVGKYHAIWEICWNKQQGYFDFTQESWRLLSTSQKILLAGAYQRWYAQQQGQKSIEKIFRLGETTETITMLLIPPGKFYMGSPADEDGRTYLEVLRKVLLTESFWLGKYELTQKQWLAMAKTTPWLGSEAQYQLEKKLYRAKSDDLLPATMMSWEEVTKILANTKYYLPTEAQWEYACRGGTTEAFYWGRNALQAVEYENAYDIQATNIYGGFPINNIVYQSKIMENDGYPDLAHVGQYKRNAFGLHDMVGNVGEWCRDMFAEYAATEVTNPVVEHLSLWNARSFRGGGWYAIRYRILRCASRYSSPPDKGSVNIGVRFARALK